MLIESLRDYQIKALDELRDGVRKGHRSQILVAPTGAGKTVSASYLLNEARAKQNVAWFICDRVSLVDQTSATLDRYGVPHGVIQADHWRWRPYEYVQVISAQTLARRKIDNEPKLIVVDECFVAGSMVSTPNGMVPIELVRHGDLVLNATGVGKVLGTSARPVGKREIVKVSFDDGTEIYCTKEHRFFTTELWVQAGQLAGKSVFDEKAMLGLWRRDQACYVQNEGGEYPVPIKKGVGGKADLLKVLCEEIEKPHARFGNENEGKPVVETDGAQTEDTRREWDGFVEASRNDAESAWRRLDSRTRNHNKAEEFGVPASLQDRSSESRSDDCDRGGWHKSLRPGEESPGQEEGRVSCLPRVVSVQTIKSESNQVVYNLHIEGHPSYFINGKLVHNCHVLHRSVINAIEKYPDAIVVGLTATPFTKGLSKIFTNVVNSTTTDKLINDGWLVPVKMFVAKSEMDMRGAAVKFDGEWAEKDMEKQGVEIVGDIVTEWVQATNKHFGGPVKTIVFSATVAHGEELCREFAQRGYNFQQISYKDGNNERRRELIEEFRKPDSDIIGLISCEALAKGFDVTDIKIGVCARPYRKSLSGHIQQMGRVMRPHQGKDFAVWLCLARGSRVLTDRGLIPIEKVTKDHKIWDGCNFITHGGAVCNGIRKVITYQGLTATPNHLVHTKDGWRTFGECAKKQIVITQTGLGWSPIRIGGDRGSSRYVVGEKGKQKTPRHMRVRDLFQQIGDFFSQPDWSKDQRLQELQPAGPGLSRLALFESSSHEGKVLQPEKRSVSTLRRERDRVQVSWGKGRDHLDHEQLGYTGIRNQARSWLRTTRSNRYKWALRAWKFALGLYQTKSVQQKGSEVGGTHAPLQDEKPRNKIFGQYIAKVFRNRHDRRPDHRKVPQTIVETEREVWDILNAGPHNRFTCEGLLVHNCHAGNLTRFWEDQVDVFAHGVQELEDGKLDAKVRKEPTEKEKAEIKCTACGYMFRGRVCPSCGAERRAMSNVLAVQGQMVEFGGTKSSDWMSDKRLVWWEIVQISKDRKRGDLAAAERFAKAQYKNLTGEWPRWKFHEAIFVEPRMVTQNKIKQQVIKYAKSRFARRQGL